MTRTIRSDIFRVDFLSSNDRIAHIVYVADARGVGSEPSWFELLHSVEGSPDAVWPGSPPLQELHFDSHDGRNVALLVGRAGKSHWSASIGCEAATGASGGATDSFVFDMACRVSTSPGELGSSYQLAEDVSWRSLDPSDEDGACRSIALEAPDGRTWRLAVDSPGSMRFEAAARRIQIGPPAIALTPPVTIRWRFVLQGPPT